MDGYITTMGAELETSAAGDRALGSGYLLSAMIGGGATGQVFRGVRKADGAFVAIKVLRAELAQDPDAVVRFLRQRTVLASVTHPNLVGVHDLVAEGDLLAVIMDLVEGDDLRRVMRTRGLAPAESVRILTQVAEALAAVHAAGVVHRDIKPENVIVRWDGVQPHSMLTDFGLAKVLDSPVWTSASQLHGTPAYLAPEVVTGRAAGPEADVYALAVMAYELLSGSRPFKADNPAALLLAHVDAEAARPEAMPDHQWRLVRAGLAKDPAARPTAAQFAAGLRGEAYDVTEASTLDAIRPAPVAPQEIKPRSKRWMMWAAIGLCVILGVSAGLWYGQPHSRTSQTPEKKPYQVPLTATATSHKAGEITVTFPDANSYPGFDSYIIYVDKTPVEQLDAAAERTYTYSAGDRTTRYCFTVVALVLADKQPVAPLSQPSCAVANGKSPE
jgi:hypothetical protein